MYEEEYEEEQEFDIDDPSLLMNLSDDDDDDDDDIEFDDIEDKKSKSKIKSPKLIGKHSLTYDVIFKGKKTNQDEEFQSEHIIKNAGGSLDINDDILDFEESRSNIEYYRDTRLKREIRRILLCYTDIDFNAPRRKPSRSDFNAYFQLILTDLHKFGYNKTEIFIELSGYFSDNIWNIFLLLDNKYSNIIIDELKDKYGLSDIDKINFL